MDEVNKNMRKPVISFLVLVIVLILAARFYFKDKEITPRQKDSFFGKEVSSFCFENRCFKKESSNQWIYEENGIKKLADQEMAANMLTKFEKVKLDELVSANPEKSKELGFGGDQAVFVEANNKTLEIGNVNLNYDGTFVKDKSNNDIFMVPFVWDKSFFDLKSWDNKFVANFPIYQAKKIIIKTKDKTKELTVKDGKWDNQALAEKALYLKSINNLGAINDLGEAVAQIEVEMDNGKYSYQLGKKVIDKNTIYWGKSNDGYAFEISKDDYSLLTGQIR